MAKAATSNSRPDGFWPASALSLEAAGLLRTIRMPGAKQIVDVLKNADRNPRFYVGLTADVRARLEDHNAGRCPHTARYRPWQLHVIIEFSDQDSATRFERYLKSGSGREFAKRHFDS